MTYMVCLGHHDGRLSRSSSSSASQRRSIVVLVLVQSSLAVVIPVGVVLVEWTVTVAFLAPSSSVGSSVCQPDLGQLTDLQQDSEQDSVEQPE